MINHALHFQMLEVTLAKLCSFHNQFDLSKVWLCIAQSASKIQRVRLSNFKYVWKEGSWFAPHNRKSERSAKSKPGTYFFLAIVKTAHLPVQTALHTYLKPQTLELVFTGTA